MDILDALESADIEVREGSSDEEIRICCPFCFEEGEQTIDEKFRLGINTVTGKANCFNCGKRSNGGDYITNELQRVLETGEIELLQTERKHKKKKHHKVGFPEGFQLLQHPRDNDDHWNREAWRYVRDRGITQEQIKEKEIGYSVIGDFHHRIIFPVFRHSKLIGLVGRDLTGKQEPKYRNSVGSKTIYNLPDKTKHKMISLQEGVFDTLVVERASLRLGIDSGGVLGHSIKEDQWELLDRYHTIILWFDPDKVGIEGMLATVKSAPKNKIIRIVLPTSFKHEGAIDKDPSELEYKEIMSRLEHPKLLTRELQDKLRAWLAFEE